MPRIKIDKKALKENEVEIFVLKLRDLFQQDPKKIIIPVVAVVAAVVLGVFTTRYFKQQNTTSELRLFQAELQYRSAMGSSDRSNQIVGLQKALTDFKNIVSENSLTVYGKIAGAYVGDCYYHLGQYDEAIKAYRDAISHGAPKITAALAQMSIGYAYLNKSDYKSAIAEFQKVETNYPDSFLLPSVKFEIGDCYEKQNDPAKAKDTYERLVKTYPDSTWKEEAEARLSILTGSVATTAAG